MDGAVLRKIFGCLSMTPARCGGMFTATSISPFWSAATRTASSGMGLNTTVLIFGAPPQYPRKASITISSSFAQRTNLYGPVPIGALEIAAVSLPAYSFGGYIAAWRRAMWLRNTGQGFLVWIRTVY